MRRTDFLHLLKRQPFRAFRITVTTGEVFEVLHPETIFVARNFVGVPVDRLRTESERADDFVWLDLLHVVHVQPGRRAKAVS